MEERCTICNCLLHRTAGTYARPTPEGRSHATKHHYVAERFFGRSSNRKGTKHQGIFEVCPWGHEGETAVFCYECHEELLHNPVFMPEDFDIFSKDTLINSRHCILTNKFQLALNPMKQQSLEVGSFEKYRKKTRKEQFLEEMDQIIPWEDLCQAIKPYYPKPKGAGRRPVGIERMLRIHFLQHWFELSDPGAEEALYDSRAMRQFVGIDLGKEPVPDETTILNFRHLMEKYNLGDELFRLVNVYLAESGLKVNRGTIVDATIINAPTSTKNKDKQRDPDMHQTRKGNQWYFGMKTHIGVDNKTKLIHSIVVTAANVHDSQVLDDLLHGDETHLWGDSAYAGQKQLLYELAPNAKDFTQKKGSRYRQLTEAEKSANRYKSKIRSRVEHVFGVMKRQFGFTKVRYRGLDKNAHCVFTKCALVNLVLAKKQLLAI